MVAVIPQVVPAPPVAVNVDPVIEQPAVPDVVTAYETEPEPEPPVDVRVSDAPKTTVDAEVIDRADWLMRDTVTARVFAPEEIVPSEAEIVADPAL